MNSEGVREVLGMAVGPSEAEPFWTDFLRSLTRPGLRGLKLVISDAHEGLKGAGAKVLAATWQRCKVHFRGNALARAGKDQRQMVLAAINTRKVYGVPKTIRVDNGPEFVSKELDLWAYSNGVTLDFSRPGNPTDNAFIEPFNARVRQECLTSISSCRWRMPGPRSIVGGTTTTISDHTVCSVK